MQIMEEFHRITEISLYDKFLEGIEELKPTLLQLKEPKKAPDWVKKEDDKLGKWHVLLYWILQSIIWVDRNIMKFHRIQQVEN